MINYSGGSMNTDYTNENDSAISTTVILLQILSEPMMIRLIYACVRHPASIPVEQGSTYISFIIYIVHA